jgi:Family of unknown function (DUF5670)
MGILEAIAGLLLVLWILGLVIHVGGAFIHALLVIAVILFLLRFITGKTAV